ncbi:MAG TPA: phosphoribosylglycinamide formyltransferase [Terriglobia bacterium]|nr:phosphoribosylglycinamide formyltransferase [Terriglobia bacterium]
MKNLGILISGRGSNFEAIARNVASGKIPARIVAVISNRTKARGLELAREMGLNARCISSQGRTREDFEGELLEALESLQTDLICLAGFMRVLSPDFVKRFPNRILNIHPSLLPAFPGMDAQKQALEHGVKWTGCTVHIVNEGVDSGPIVLQAAVPVLDEDTVETLSARILEQEHRIYPEAVKLLVEDQIRIQGRRVLMKKDGN